MDKFFKCRIDANVYLQTCAVSMDKYSRGSLIYGHQRDKVNCPYHKGRGCLKFFGAFGPSRIVLNIEVSVREVPNYIRVAEFCYFLFVSGG